MTSSITNITTTPTALEAPAPKPASDIEDPLASKETFLQLLVAQIKNQNPLNPQDGVEFLSQLAQFTQVEQSVAMRQDIAAIKDFFMPPSSTEAGTPAN